MSVELSHPCEWGEKMSPSDINTFSGRKVARS